MFPLMYLMLDSRPLGPLVRTGEWMETWMIVRDVTLGVLSPGVGWGRTAYLRHTFVSMSPILFAVI